MNYQKWLALSQEIMYMIGGPLLVRVREQAKLLHVHIGGTMRHAVVNG